MVTDSFLTDVSSSCFLSLLSVFLSFYFHQLHKMRLATERLAQQTNAQLLGQGLDDGKSSHVPTLFDASVTLYDPDHPGEVVRCALGLKSRAVERRARLRETQRVDEAERERDRQTLAHRVRDVKSDSTTYRESMDQRDGERGRRSEEVRREKTHTEAHMDSPKQRDKKQDE